MSDTYNGVKSENKVTMVSKNNRTQLLQAAVICLSLASFYTTAQGMNNYIFKNPSIAYITSGAIQGILLALSMNLPRFIENIWGKNWWKNKILKVIQAVLKIVATVLLLLLTGISLICSSWFSYIYIADVVYGDSWSADSELLVQQTYRNELYKANDYARAYRTYLEENMGDQILQLEQQARQLKEKEIEIELDWDEERAQYVDVSNVASEYMRQVIDSMERASVENASQADRDTALTAITQTQENIEAEMTSIDGELNRISENMQSIATYLSNLNTQYNQATSDADRASIAQAQSNYLSQQQELSNREALLQADYNAFSDANSQLTLYANQLGITDKTSSLYIRSSLLKMQTEFFEAEPDEEVLINTATDIFTSLRNASTQSADQGTNDAASYSALLSQMNSLILSLKDYADTKEIAGALDSLISNLRKMDEKNGTDEENQQQTNEESDADEVNQQQTNEESDADEENQQQTNGESGSKGETQNEWKVTWLENLQELKNLISGMPLYLERTLEGASESEQTNAAIKMQQEILLNYDRSASSSALDDMIRRYVSNHNALYQGIIYLQSPQPYNDLAWFALALAALLDLAGFVFGFVDLGSKHQSVEYSQEETTEESSVASESYSDKNTQKELTGAWSVVPSKNSYVIMTGDYEYRDGIYLYHIFKNGLLESWKTKEKISPETAIIQQEGKNLEKGISMPSDEHPIRFAHQTDSPQDGIYHHGRLSYEGGMLFWEPQDTKADRKGSQQLLAGVEEFVPVYCFDARSGINETLPVSDLKVNEINADTLVVALNPNGTEIVSIYIVKE